LKAPASTHGLRRRLLQSRGGWREEKTCGLREEKTERISGRGSHPLFGLLSLTSDGRLELLPCLGLGLESPRTAFSGLGRSNCLERKKNFLSDKGSEIILGDLNREVIKIGS
jgi:hypothetical protein